jgi:hypothetical protein
MEAGYRRAHPVCNHVLSLEIHDIVWFKDGGGNGPDNLLALCPNCHSLHTAGHIPPEAIRYWKQMLITLNHSFDMRSRDLLLLLRSTDGDGISRPYSADGDATLAPLLATGLAEAQFKQGGSGGGPPFAVFKVGPDRPRTRLAARVGDRRRLRVSASPRGFLEGAPARTPESHACACALPGGCTRPRRRYRLPPPLARRWDAHGAAESQSTPLLAPQLAVGRSNVRKSGSRCHSGGPADVLVSSGAQLN